MDSTYTKYLQEQSRENTYVLINFQKHLRVYTSIPRGTFFNSTELQLKLSRAQTSVKHDIFLQGCITGQWNDGNMETDVKKCYFLYTFQCGTRE